MFGYAYPGSTPFAGFSGTEVILPPAVVAAGRFGKYKPEHDSALIDLAAARGFGPEHSGALTDLGDAGI